MLFVNLFVHTREFNHSTYIGVKTVFFCYIIDWCNVLALYLRYIGRYIFAWYFYILCGIIVSGDISILGYFYYYYLMPFHCKILSMTMHIFLLFLIIFYPLLLVLGSNHMAPFQFLLRFALCAKEPHFHTIRGILFIYSTSFVAVYYLFGSQGL